MNPNRVRAAAIELVEQVKAGKTVDLDIALMGDDPVSWLADAGADALRKDEARLKKSLREGVRRGASFQIELPGMEHAAVPFVVFATDEDGVERALPVWAATLGQIRREVELHRRAVSNQDRIVSGYEATLDRLPRLGIPESTTGAEMLEQFPMTSELGF